MEKWKIFLKSDNMMIINGKVDKPLITDSIFFSLLERELHQNLMNF